MITITRRLAQQLRAVLRRAFGTRGPGPALCFTADAGTLSVRARIADIAVTYSEATTGPAETLWLPFQFLDDCASKRDDQVHVEVTGKGRCTAQWRDGSVPQIVQYDSPEPPAADTFPAAPENFAENPVRLLRALADEVAAEAPLVDPDSGEDLGVPLVGVIDLVLDNVAGPLIVDFKTAARSSEPMEISNEIQLSSYAWLHRQITGRQEGGMEIRSLIKTKQAKCEFHPYPARTEVHFRRLFSVIREYLDALDRGTFNFRPGWNCGLCDFCTGPCRAWAG